MTEVLRNEEYSLAPIERTLIYDNQCLIDCKPAQEKIYHNTDGTFDAVIIIEGNVVAEWARCPNVEYAAESIMEFDVTEE